MWACDFFFFFYVVVVELRLGYDEVCAISCELGEGRVPTEPGCSSENTFYP